MDRFDRDHQAEEGLLLERQRKTRRPKRYKVLLHNDDYTTMDFVIQVLETYFSKAPAEATQIMLQVHYQGVGVAGVYPREVAETKVAEATADARAQGMPLLLTTEVDGGEARP